MGAVIAGVVGVALILFLLIRLAGRRGPKPNSRELTMGVWAAFGPYDSVEDAERSLYRSTRAVFGDSSLNEHDSWIRGHADNFRMWDKSGTLKQSLEFMRHGTAAFAVGRDFDAACVKYKEELKTETLRLLDNITTDLGMEAHAPVMRALIDGSMDRQQIHEKLEANQIETAERIVRQVGENVLSAPSVQAAQMREFLQGLSREHKGEDATTPEALGRLYLICINYAGDNPDSEFAKTFHALDDGWKATLQDGETT